MSDPSSTWLQSSVLIINVFECILFSYSLSQIVIRIKGLTTHFIFYLFIYLGIYVKSLYSPLLRLLRSGGKITLIQRLEKHHIIQQPLTMR